MTAVIAPSRCLRCLLAGFGASLLAAACAAGFSTSTGFSAAPLVAAALLFAGVCVMHAALGPATVHRIDISGPGQLRLTVQQGMRQDKSGALAARLLPGSTLWPQVLMLCLETAGETADGGGYRTVAVLPDCLPPDGFRALAVALGAGHAAAGASSTVRKIL